jgi:hypothetical protein
MSSSGEAISSLAARVGCFLMTPPPPILLPRESLGLLPDELDWMTFLEDCACLTVFLSSTFLDDVF